MSILSHVPRTPDSFEICSPLGPHLSDELGLTMARRLLPCNLIAKKESLCLFFARGWVPLQPRAPTQRQGGSTPFSSVYGIGVPIWYLGSPTPGAVPSACYVTKGSMNVLIGITSCHKYRDRVAAQLKTWIPQVTPEHGHLEIFVGRGPYYETYETRLDVPDDYGNLHLKSRGIIRFAYDKGYDYLFKVDDDAYVIPNRLMTSGFEAHDYIGAWIVGEGATPNSAVRYYGQRFVPGGCGMWLSRRAMKILLDSDPTKLSIKETTLEDHWVGWTLERSGIRPTCDYRYINFSCFADQQRYKTLGEYTASDEIFPPVSSVIAMCEFTPNEMMVLHESWATGLLTLPKRIVPPRPKEITVAGVRFSFGG